MIIKIIVSKFITKTKPMQELQTTIQDLTFQKSIIEVIKDFTDSFNAIKTQNRYKTVLLEFFSELNIIRLEEL